jgi:hypothetical protein
MKKIKKCFVGALVLGTIAGVGAVTTNATMSGFSTVWNYKGTQSSMGNSTAREFVWAEVGSDYKEDRNPVPGIVTQLLIAVANGHATDSHSGGWATY